MDARRSIRQYTPEPVSEADLSSLLEAGVAAPSAMNRRPWHLVVVDDKMVDARVGGQGLRGDAPC
jgi:nitroreductase